MRESARKFSQKVLGEGGVRLFATVFLLLLARSVGAEEFGRYSSALALAALCIVLVDLGTNAILTREIARHTEHRKALANTSHLLKIVAAGSAWLILWAITWLLPIGPGQRYLTLCLGIVVIGQTLTEYFAALLNGIEEMGWEAILKVICKVLSLAFGYAALALHQPLSVIATSLAAGTLLSYAAAVWILRTRFSSFGFGLEPGYLRPLLLSSLPLFGSVVFWVLYDSQDILLLNFFRFPQIVVGWFSAAMKVLDVLRVYPVLMMSVFFPVLSKLHPTDRPEFLRKERRLMLFMGGTLALLCTAVYILAPWIVKVLYKSDFAPAAGFLRLLIPALVFMGLNCIQSQVLIVLNQERKLLIGASLVCLSNIALACLLLPRIGVAGACYALLGSEMAYFIFLWRTVRASL